MLGDDLGRDVADAHEVVGARLHRKRAPAHAAADKGVVNHDAAVRQHIAHVAGNEKECRHAGRDPQANGANGAADGAHDVVEGKAGAHLAAWAVDEQRDGVIRVGLLKMSHAANDVCHRVRIDGPAELELAIGEHLVADIEPLQAKRCLVHDEWRIGIRAHGRPFVNGAAAPPELHEQGRSAASRAVF